MSFIEHKLSMMLMEDSEENLRRIFGLDLAIIYTMKLFIDFEEKELERQWLIISATACAWSSNVCAVQVLYCKVSI
jgi:hypothetical protein